MLGSETRALTVLVVGLAAAACGATSSSEPAPAPGGSRTVAIDVAHGYTPDEIVATPGEALHLVFTRSTDATCGQELVFPDLAIRRDLPLGVPVAVDVTAPASGRLSFTCGMDMYRGSVVVR